MDVDTEQLPAMLTRLKLTAIRDQLDNLLDEASRSDLSLRETVAFLCAREIARKGERRIEMGMRIAHFPEVCPLESCDFDAQPSVDPHQIRDFALCRWVAHGDALLFLGTSGVGTSHFTIALGREAVRYGHSVLLVTAPVLVAHLAKAHGDGRLEERLAHYPKPKLLIVDELGYLLFEADESHLLFQLVFRRTLRPRQHAGDQQQGDWQVGQRVRRHDDRGRDPRPPAAPQPRHHDSRGELETPSTAT